MALSFTQDIERKIAECSSNPNVIESLKGLIDAAKILHAEERNISLLSVRLVGMLEEVNGPGRCWLSREGFAWYIGLTPNTYWKRAQAWRVICRFPEISEMVKKGETCVSHVAMLSAKITASNAKVLIEGLKNKSTRELRDFVATVNADGSIKPAGESMVEIKLRLSLADAKLIERAREVMAHSGLRTTGAVPSEEDVVVAALNLLLDRKDPARKAERAATTSASMQNSIGYVNSASEKPDTAATTATEATVEMKTPAARQESQQIKGQCRSIHRRGNKRSHIPNAIRHQVWQRDKGRCTHDFGAGNLCGDRYLIEIDHHIPWAMGGTHALNNLALKCRRHNILAAERIFGTSFMEQFRHAN